MTYKLIHNKKAVSHIEMIVSFTIFFVSALFVFSFLNPVKQPDISSSLLKSVELGIRNNYSTSLMEIPVIVDESVSLNNCFKISSPFDSEDTSPSKIFVKNMSGELTEFEVAETGCISPNPAGENPSESVGCITINPFPSNERIYYIYHILDENIIFHSASCIPEPAQLPDASYEFSIPRVRKVYINATSSINGIEQLQQEYTGNYDGLKDKFNFPRESDFAVIIKKQNTNIVKMELTREKPGKVVVKAKVVPIVILEKTSSDEVVEIRAEMNIQVW